MKNRSRFSQGLVFFGVILAMVLPVTRRQMVKAAGTALGSAFTYQGRLLVSLAPANSPHDLQFTLFDQSSGGIQIAGPITLDNVPTSNGLFTVQLDFGAAAFNGDNRFLAIGVRAGTNTGSFTLLTTRQQITATPYALYAVNAANVSGTVTCARRKYYMTSPFFTGNAATNACVAGYHMASFAEIMDTSNLDYAQNGTDLPAGTAHTLPDSGSGPPFSTLAFISAPEYLIPPQAIRWLETRIVISGQPPASANLARSSP
jgi:hypothetical protein